MTFNKGFKRLSICQLVLLYSEPCSFLCISLTYTLDRVCITNKGTAYPSNVITQYSKIHCFDNEQLKINIDRADIVMTHTSNEYKGSVYVS